MDMDREYIPEVWGPEFWKAVQELADAARVACEELRKAVYGLIASDVAGLVQALEALTVDDYPVKPRQKLPRPTRYAGPQNKGRSWTRQPPRLARSDCRKMRR